MRDWFYCKLLKQRVNDFLCRFMLHKIAVYTQLFLGFHTASLVRSQYRAPIENLIKPALPLALRVFCFWGVNITQVLNAGFGPPMAQTWPFVGPQYALQDGPTDKMPPALLAHQNVGPETWKHISHPKHSIGPYCLLNVLDQLLDSAFEISAQSIEYVCCWIVSAVISKFR